ncbi:hypothetical protein [Micromonospora haikouensis]|uniref:hypothetical protein n=1 Tax=Micromonospora haikouensis TaxID=686309 RepID=UPI00114D0072|nr:hypothetical protein [Micromonospora haikouensis]
MIGEDHAIACWAIFVVTAQVTVGLRRPARHDRRRGTAPAPRSTATTTRRRLSAWQKKINRAHARTRAAMPRLTFWPSAPVVTRSASVMLIVAGRWSASVPSAEEWIDLQLRRKVLHHHQAID